LLASENKQTMLKDAFKEIGTCIKAITIRSEVIDKGLVFEEFLLFKVNLFKEG
tara:strand:- start:136 stop:294 length:159 start_codon:yes stop_codon:yes gene_type:complete